jgi:hypothetical protein
MPIPEYSVPSAPWYSPYVVKQVMLLCETIFMYGILSEPELLEQSVILIEFYKTGIKGRGFMDGAYDAGTIVSGNMMDDFKEYNPLKGFNILREKMGAAVNLKESFLRSTMGGRLTRTTMGNLSGAKMPYVLPGFYYDCCRTFIEQAVISLPFVILSHPDVEVAAQAVSSVYHALISTNSVTRSIVSQMSLRSPPTAGVGFTSFLHSQVAYRSKDKTIVLKKRRSSRLDKSKVDVEDTEEPASVLCFSPLRDVFSFRSGREEGVNVLKENMKNNMFTSNVSLRESSTSFSAINNNASSSAPVISPYILFSLPAVLGSMYEVKPRNYTEVVMESIVDHNIRMCGGSPLTVSSEEAKLISDKNIFVESIGNSSMLRTLPTESKLNNSWKNSSRLAKKTTVIEDLESDDDDDNDDENKKLNTSVVIPLKKKTISRDDLIKRIVFKDSDMKPFSVPTEEDYMNSGYVPSDIFIQPPPFHGLIPLLLRIISYRPSLMHASFEMELMDRLINERISRSSFSRNGMSPVCLSDAVSTGSDLVYEMKEVSPYNIAKDQQRISHEVEVNAATRDIPLYDMLSNYVSVILEGEQSSHSRMDNIGFTEKMCSASMNEVSTVMMHHEFLNQNPLFDLDKSNSGKVKTLLGEYE